MTLHLQLSALVEKIQQRTREQHDDIVRFMREICAIPSMNSLIGLMGVCVQCGKPAQEVAIFAKAY